MLKMSQESAIPLVVDLDGTLTPTDTLHESLLQILKRSPVTFLRILLTLFRGKAAFKDAIAAHTSLDPALIPYRQDLLEYLHLEKQKGRPIILATAAHSSIAERVAEHLGLFEMVLATQSGENLKGVAKLQLICASIGEKFVYAGDSRADFPIWEKAESAILVGVPAGTRERVERSTPIERGFSGERARPGVWLRALRIHQWLKNLLLFVPLLTAFSFLDTGKLATLIIAFLTFSLAASATYILNDLWDLESDRKHERKRNRPFASAELSIRTGIMVAALTLGTAFGIAALVSPAFILMLLLYVVLTTAYSWKLKSYVLIDVLMLSLLYTFRILAGSVAAEITVSSWLLAFSVFIFLSLALVKRCVELVSFSDEGKKATHGKDYRVSDLDVLWPMGVSASLAAVVVFGLFINAPETQARYETPQLLWLIEIALIYWVGRLWIKTSRGEMHDDPVIYAMRDRSSLFIFLVIFIIMMVAHTQNLGALL